MSTDEGNMNTTLDSIRLLERFLVWIMSQSWFLAHQMTYESGILTELLKSWKFGSSGCTAA